MNKNSSTILSIALAVMVAFLVFSGLFLDRNLEQLKADRELTEHTYRVIETLGQVYSDLLNAEAGERALLIISDETALVRVETAIADVHKHLRALGSLVSDNPTQTENFKELEVLINERFKFTEKLSEHIQSGGGQYSKLISKDYIANARMVMGRLRPHVEKMEEIEAKLLQQRTEAAATTENFVRLILLLGSTISILSLIGVYVLFRRYLAAQAIDIKRKAHEAWLKQNEAEASRLAVTYPTVQQLSEPLLRLLIDASGAVAGNIFLASGKTLEFVAGYGSDEIRKGNIFSKEFKVGEGLVGEAALAQDIVELTNIPDKYFHIRSSLGDSAPARIVFIPLRFQEQLVGLIEVASFGQLKDSARALFRHLAPVFAAGINAAQSRDRQQALLEETQVQAEELQAQQEELRTSNEELEQQTRALAESHARMQSQQEELQQNNEELEQQARAMEEQQEFINARNVELENIRRQLETKAVDLERASVYKSEFLAKMSHELRTPLNSLMILATLLKENKHGNLNNQQIEFATTIHDAGADLLGLINDILDLSKLEARKLSARPEPFDLRSLFDQLAGTFRPLIDQKNLQFKINISQDAPEKLFTDRQRLAQIVTNFLSNAVKFTEQGSIILEASATDKSDQLMITVIDTGVGIPEEKRKLIFEAFEQADSSISRKYGGTGLGLTISRELATLLGGSILVSSETDKGSRFSIVIPTDIRTVQPVQADKKTETAAMAAPTVIPVVEVQSSISPVSTPSGPDTIQDEAYEAQAKKLLSRLSPKDRTILIVEDEANFRTAIADEARAQGFTPIEVNDAETALAVLKKHIPQAVMLDIKLPGLSGLTLLEMIKETPRLRHIPIHMVSALEYQRNALRLGAIG